MTIEIPMCLIYVMYGLGGFVAIAVVIFVGALALIGWELAKSFSKPKW